MRSTPAKGSNFSTSLPTARISSRSAASRSSVSRAARPSARSLPRFCNHASLKSAALPSLVSCPLLSNRLICPPNISVVIVRCAFNAFSYAVSMSVSISTARVGSVISGRLKILAISGVTIPLFKSRRIASCLSRSCVFKFFIFAESSLAFSVLFCAVAVFNSFSASVICLRISGAIVKALRSNFSSPN